MGWRDAPLKPPASRRASPLTRFGALAAGLGKGLKERLRDRAFHARMLRMPLHAKGKGAGAGNADGLDEAVGSGRLGNEPRAQAVDALGVERVHHHLLGAEEPGQRAAGQEAARVRRSIALSDRLRFVGTMVALAVDLVHELVQA